MATRSVQCIVALAAALLLVQMPVGRCRDVSHAELRDIMYNVGNAVRVAEDKLERHEYREKQLGDLIKKDFTGLEKRHRNLDSRLGRLDERVAGVETVLMQSEERNRVQNDEIKDAITEMSLAIKGLTKKLSEPVAKPAAVDTTLLKALSDQIHDIKTSIDDLKLAVAENKKQKTTLDEKSTNLLTNLAEKTAAVASVIGTYETKLEELNVRDIPSDISTVSYKEPTESENKILVALESQRSILVKLSNDSQLLNAQLKEIPNLGQLMEVTNKTLESLGGLKYELKINNNRTYNKMNDRLSTIETALMQNHEESVKTIADMAVMSDNVYAGISKSYEQLRTDVQALSKVEKVMIQTADNVLDTKRRIEYGVRQILVEVGDLVKVQNQELNGTVNKRFDDIELTILDNQTGALANLTTKLETEMSQVWRQIGIMYQQLTASKTALDRLQAQTEIYVNGSLSTMDSMEGKVGQITGRMVLVDENLNFLLGKLSLVTQEFNQIKVGLGSALDQIRSSFHAVQSTVKNVGPGPHRISEAENETTDK